MDTLRAVKDAGMEMCSGGIIGMGERDEDTLTSLANRLARLDRALSDTEKTALFSGTAARVYRLQETL